MTLYRLTFYPNGHLDGERLDTGELDPATMEGFRPLFDGGPVFRSAIPTGAGEVSVKWTGADAGHAMFFFSYNEQLFLSGVLVAGKDPAGDAETLRMWTQSLENAPLLQQVTGGRPDPFQPLLARHERPLLASVVWPTLPVETFQQIAGLDILLSVEFLRRFGMK